MNGERKKKEENRHFLRLLGPIESAVLQKYFCLEKWRILTRYNLGTGRRKGRAKDGYEIGRKNGERGKNGGEKTRNDSKTLIKYLKLLRMDILRQQLDLISGSDRAIFNLIQIWPDPSWAYTNPIEPNPSQLNRPEFARSEPGLNFN